MILIFRKPAVFLAILVLAAISFVLSNDVLASVSSALDYAPNLWFDSEEQYYPVNPLDFYFENNQEISGQKAVEKYNQLSFQQKLNNLTVLYNIQDYGDEWVYQYWFFYVFNGSLGKIKNQHYGDWEAVFVFVNKNSKKINKVIGTAHQRRLFDTEILNPSDNHIWTYIGNGSHANCVDREEDGHCDSFRWRRIEKWDKNGHKAIYNSYKLKEITPDFVNKFSDKPTLEKSGKLGISIPNFLEIITKEIYIPLGGSPPIYAWHQSSYYNPEELRPITGYISEAVKRVKNGFAGFFSGLADKLVNLFKGAEYQQAGILTSSDDVILTTTSNVDKITWFIADQQENQQENQETSLPEPVFSQAEKPVQEQEAVSVSAQGEIKAQKPVLPQEPVIKPVEYRGVSQTSSTIQISTSTPPVISTSTPTSTPDIIPTSTPPVISTSTPTSTPDIIPTSTPPVISTSTPVVAHPVINEIQLWEYEFVELYNPTNQPIDMTGWYWSYYSSNRDWNNPYRNKPFSEAPEPPIIPAGGYYLIGLNGYPESGGYLDADWQVYGSSQLHDKKGSIAIFPWDPTSTTSVKAEMSAIDALGWGQVDHVYKTATSSPPGRHQSLALQSNGEFIVDDWPSPRNSQGQTITMVPDSTEITQDTTWYLENSPYILQRNKNKYPTIFNGATLFIEPGVVVKTIGKHYPGLVIKGVLNAQGTTSTPITFTTINDTPQKGDWSGIIFDNAQDGSILEYVDFEYGGSATFYQRKSDLMAMVKIIDSKVDIRNANFRQSAYSGIYLDNSDSSLLDCVFEDIGSIGVVIDGAQPSITGCEFDNNQIGIKIVNQASPIINNNTFSDGYYSIVIISAYPVLSDNQAIDNGFNGIFIHQDSLFVQDFVWKSDLPYILSSGAGKGNYPTVASGTSLTIEPGVIIKPTTGSYINLFIQGSLIAQGTTSTPIVFTSFKDDVYGGDTNNDNSDTVPKMGDWKVVRFEPGSSGDLNHILFRYSGVEYLDIDDLASVVLGGDIQFEP